MHMNAFPVATLHCGERNKRNEKENEKEMKIIYGKV